MAVAVAGVALASAGVVPQLRGDGRDSIVEAGRRTAETGSARVVLSTVLDGGVGAPKQRIDASGVVNFAEASRHLDFRVGAPRDQVDGPVTGVALSVVEVAGESFHRYSAWDADQPWVRSTAEPATGGLDEFVLGNRWDLILDAADEVRVVGVEVVGGVDTTHYAMTVDLRDLTSSMGPEALGEVPRAAVEGRMVMDVWLGERIQRVRYDLDAGGSARGGDGTGSAPIAAHTGVGASVTTVVEYRDFGVAADIREPVNVVDDELTGTGTEEDGA